MLEGFSESLRGALSKLKGARKLTEENIADGLREIRRALLEADVNIKVAKNFVKSIKEKAVGQKVIDDVDPSQQIVKIVHDELVDLLGGEQSPLELNEDGTTIILMAGLQGAGKTTTCGKLARHFIGQGKKVLLVAADLKRPAAIEQLKVVAGQVGAEFYMEPTQNAPQVCENGVAKARQENFDVVLLDTAGRLHVDQELMDEVQSVARVTDPDEVILVIDSMTGQDAVTSAAAFNESLELSGVILTKLDSDTRGGAALSLRAVTGKPIKFVGVGEKLDRLEVFHPDRLAGRILGMGDVVSLVEKAQEVIDEDEAMGLMQKMMSGKFGLDDLVKQMERMRKMGPLKHIMKMIPGMGDMLGDADLDAGEGELKRVEAMVQSMTPKERANPDLIDSSRRYRIARGSGFGTKDVQGVLKQFYQMKKMMKQFAPMMGAAAENPDQPAKGLSRAEIKKMRREMMKKRK